MLYFTHLVGNIDGLGAQYQRIISIISLAEKYGCEYVHTKIKEMGHLPDTGYLEKIEDYFQISNNFKSVNDIIYDETIELIFDTSEKIIESYKIKAKDKNILICIVVCYNMIDGYHRKEGELYCGSSIYNLGMSKIQTIKKDIPVPEYNNNQNKNIAIHIRRGDVTSIEEYPDRYISLDYYQLVINKLNVLYPNSNVFIFTEISPQDKPEFDKFQNRNPDVKILADIDILTTLEYMIKADVLVMAKSSFSFVAGLYNTNTVYYIRFGHLKLERWIHL